MSEVEETGCLIYEGKADCNKCINAERDDYVDDDLAGHTAILIDTLKKMTSLFSIKCK